MERQTMNEQLEEILKGLTGEQRAKLAGCESADELFVLLGEMGAQLPDELLDAATGGATYCYSKERNCWEVLDKNKNYVLESNIGSEREAKDLAAFWSYVEDRGDIPG